jgi:diguanylate cyclase (GGDEF)-like protein
MWRNNKLRAIIFLLGILVLFTNEFGKLDTLIYDFLLKTAPPTTQNHTVIIAIDDKSINEIGRWPWSRDVHATLLNTLSSSEAHAIGFDILFAEPDKQHPERDTHFSSTIKDNKSVVLTVAPRSPTLTTTGELLPIPMLADQSAAIGHVDLELDNDGLVRSLYLFAGWKESKWPSFALALAQLATPNKKYETSTLTIGNHWTRRQPVYIPFTGNAGTIPTYSYIDVISKRINPNAFKNKVVIVGMTAMGLSDGFATPYSTNHQNMPGVEVNAHIVNGLISDTSITPVEPWLSHTLKLVLILLGLVITYFSPSIWLLPGVVAQVAMSVLVSGVLLFSMSLWFEPALTIISQLLIFSLASLINTRNTQKKIVALQEHIGHDPVTLLPTQRQLKQIIVKALQQANGELDFALVVINIGKFKEVNELLGFKAGDHLLNIASTRINTCIDNKHQCARFNGPEFTIFFKGIEGKEQLESYCNALYELLGKPYQIQNETFELPISIGASFYPKHGTKLDDLFDAAVTAMQKAKKQIDRGICYYDDEIKASLVERKRMISDLTQAIERNEIEVYYQPQVDSENHKIIGVEALARWNHPERGMILPDEFIPIAESTGLIVPIGEWILKTACLAAKSWHNNGNNHLKVAVNLSSVQFAQPSLIESVAHALNNAQLPAKFLELELTESSLMKDMNKAISVLNLLKNMGVKLSIDDFGTGYSSLSYLKQFPMDRIKIDRLFISELESSSDAKEITLAIISMAHSLKMSVIAEGVETLEQQLFLNNNACEELQGFYFSKPITANDLNSLLGSPSKPIE